MRYSLLLVNNTIAVARHPNCAGRVSYFIFPTLDDLTSRTFTTTMSWGYIGQSKNNVRRFSEICWTPLILAIPKTIPCVDVTVDQFYVASTTIHSLTLRTPWTRDGRVASPLLSRTTQTDLQVDISVLRTAFKEMIQFSSTEIRYTYTVMPEHSLRLRMQRISIKIPFIKRKHHMFLYLQQKWISQKEYYEICVNILKFRCTSVNFWKKIEVTEGILWLTTINLNLKHYLFRRISWKEGLHIPQSSYSREKYCRILLCTIRLTCCSVCPRFLSHISCHQMFVC
jgi:hypothetical protein